MSVARTQAARTCVRVVGGIQAQAWDAIYHSKHSKRLRLFPQKGLLLGDIFLYTSQTHERDKRPVYRRQQKPFISLLKDPVPPPLPRLCRTAGVAPALVARGKRYLENGISFVCNVGRNILLGGRTVGRVLWRGADLRRGDLLSVCSRETGHEQREIQHQLKRSSRKRAMMDALTFSSQ